MNRRTALITAGAVAGTLLAGTGAIAANIAVLNSADDSSVGNLSAEMPVPSVAAEPQIVDVYVQDPPPATVAPTQPATVPPSTVPAGQQYTVEDAGSITLTSADATLFVEAVVANPEWQWSSKQPTPGEVQITFAHPDKTYEVYAALSADGTIDVRVDQPVVNVVEVPAPGGGGGSSGQAANPQAPANVGNDYEDDDEYEDDDDYEDDDEYEHEDDENDHEYEDGSDDDD